jgi:Domain of unknown function (DUF5753)/Helix-turn-helix domain
VTTAPPDGGPTVRRRVLGVELRRLREDAGVTRQRAGYSIRASESKISRMELGQVGFKERDVTDLLNLYGITERRRCDEFLTMAREANQPGWWQPYNDAVPTWFRSYVGLEEAAQVIRTYEVQFIPGLLQTEDYARAIMRQGVTEVPADELDQRIELRMRRQKLLTGPDPPHLWAVVDEAALRRPIGGRFVLKAQIERLIEAAQLPRVTLQVMPFDIGGHAGEAGAFSILRFPEPELPDIVYIEQLTHAVYLEKPDEVDQYLATMERVSVQSASPDQTVTFLNQILSTM